MTGRCAQLSTLPSPPPGKVGWPWTQEAVRSDQATLPRISIVTPSFNQVDYLEETIRSVLLQGYPNLEFMVIDGGSTDGSIDIIKRYDPWIDFWVSQPDKGQSDAINRGWKRSTGDILAYLNSDDIYFPGALNAVAAQAVQFPDVSMLFGDSCVVDETGSILKNHTLRDVCLEEILSWRSLLAQPAVFWRHAILKQMGYLDENLQYMMDYDLFIRTAAKADIKHVPRRLATMRIHPRTKTISQPYKRIEEAIQVAETFFTRNPQIGSPRLKDQTISALRLHEADVFCLRGDAPRARKTAWDALNLHPSPHNVWHAFLLFLKTLLNQEIAGRLRTVKKKWQRFLATP